MIIILSMYLLITLTNNHIKKMYIFKTLKYKGKTYFIIFYNNYFCKKLSFSGNKKIYI